MGEEKIDVETFAAQLNARQLQCRELGHTWTPQTVTVIRNAIGPRGRRTSGYERVMRCRSCRSERKQLLDSTGHVLRNGYVYPNGYLASNVEGGFSRDTFRLEAVTRFITAHPDQTSTAVGE